MQISGICINNCFCSEIVGNLLNACIIFTASSMAMTQNIDTVKNFMIFFKLFLFW